MDFRNAIIVMTTNIGAEEIRRQGSLGFQLARDEAIEDQQKYDTMRKTLLDSLKKVFRPEFLNRLDSIIVFHALNRVQIREIVTLEIRKVSDRLKEHNLTLQATDAALNKLADEGYDPEMGARPLRRVIQQKIEDALSDKLLAGEFVDGDAIWIDLDDDGEITLSKKKAKAKREKVKEPV